MSPAAPEQAIQTPEADTPARRRLWTVAEFERLIDLGVFGPEERLELIQGELIRKIAQREPHVASLSLTLETLRTVLPASLHVRVQAPLKLGTRSRPEPDLAVVPGAIRDYAQRTPTTAALVVGVSDSTLASDRATKAALYARAAIPEYWIVNIPDRVLEVHREPAPMTGRPLGHGYGRIARHGIGEAVAPLAAPGVPRAVADLLP